MEVKQIYEIVNSITKEVLGETAVVNEDLSNIVDIGTEIFNANAVDNYVQSLVDHIGKVIFVNRVYKGYAPSVLMDGWEYGSVLEKVSTTLPTATENESWELTDGTSYDPNVFYKPTVSVKFYNSKTTIEIDRSITMRQVKESFTTPTQLNSFISMLYTAVENSLTIKIDALIMRTINNMIAETINADYGSDSLTSTSHVKAINLLVLYNDANGTALTAEEALKTPEFIRFAVYTIGLYPKRLSSYTTLFNVGGTAKFTPKDMLHIVMLNEFDSAVGAYLQSDTYHNELIALPNHEVVPYWQGSGEDFSFSSTSSINVKTSSGSTVSTSGILCVMFDRDAIGVCNQDRRVTTNYNGKAEFYNYFYKFDCSYFNDLNENCVVFFIA